MMFDSYSYPINSIDFGQNLFMETMIVKQKKTIRLKLDWNSTYRNGEIRFGVNHIRM